MLKFVLKRNHEAFIQKERDAILRKERELYLEKEHEVALQREREFYLMREKEHLKRNFVKYENRNNSYKSCEDRVCGCIDWDAEDSEEILQFMGKAPNQWTDSFIKPNNEFHKKANLQHEEPPHHPEVEVIPSKNNKKLSTSIIPWNLLECQENLQKARKRLLPCQNILILDTNSNNEVESVDLPVHRQCTPETRFQMKLETIYEEEDVNNCANTPDETYEHEIVEADEENPPHLVQHHMDIKKQTLVEKQYQITITFVSVKDLDIYELESRLRFSDLHAFTDRVCNLPVMITTPRVHGKINPCRSVSRIPVRIKGYVWPWMIGKTFPELIRPIHGSKIPIRTISHLVYQNISSNANSPRNEDEMRKKNVVSLPEIHKRKSKIPVRIRGYVWNDVDSHDFDRRKMENKLRRKLAPVSKIPVLRARAPVKIPRLGQDEHLPFINTENSNLVNEPWQGVVKGIPVAQKQEKQDIKPQTIKPKPARLPPIQCYTTANTQEHTSYSPSHSPDSTLSDLNLSSNACVSFLSLENISEKTLIQYTIRPASVTGYPLLPPVGVSRKRRPSSADGRRRLPPLNVERNHRPTSAAGYSILPPIVRMV